MGRSKKKTKHSWRPQSIRRAKTPNEACGQAEAEAEAEVGGGKGRRFFGCYLLTSLSPRHKGHTYIGFTVNPKRRIRQHNGEITSGASHTRMKRPWEMVFCIHGFPTKVAALQFEWAWQHPMESVAVREAAATFKTRGGLANKIKLALTMLTLHSWKSMHLTVSFFSTMYMKHTAGCPSLPQQMKLHFCSMDELPCYWDADHPYGYGHDEDVLDSHHNEDFGDLGEDIHLSPFNGFVEMNYGHDKDDIDPHHNEDFGDLGEDRHLYPFNGYVEVNHSSDDIQNCTIQNASEGIWNWDQRGVGGLLESESFLMMGNATLEEHQVPSDVRGSSGNSMNEQVQLSKEIRTKGLKHSSSILEEHSKPFRRVDPSNKESPTFPMLEEHMRSFPQSPTGIHKSDVNNMNEQSQFSNEIRTEVLRGSVHAREEHIETIHRVDPFEAESPLMVSRLPITESTTKEQSQQINEQPPSRAADSFRPSLTEGIEVIDLFTPSPDCRIIAGSKKRRVACDSSDIIDLTRSPLFIQL